MTHKAISYDGEACVYNSIICFNLRCRGGIQTGPELAKVLLNKGARIGPLEILSSPVTHKYLEGEAGAGCSLIINMMDDCRSAEPSTTCLALWRVPDASTPSEVETPLNARQG